MELLQGYLIVRKSRILIEKYEGSSFAFKNAEPLRHLRLALSFLNPLEYRGIAREPLFAYPSLDDGIIQVFRETGGDMDTNKAARIKMLEFTVAFDDDDLLEKERQARDAFALLDHPDDYEIILATKEPSIKTNATLGFDIGYWGGDHFSLIRDCGVMPAWHPPDSEDLEELIKHLKKLNRHLLFDAVEDAKIFREWYRKQSWAERESTESDRFWIIQVDQVLI